MKIASTQFSLKPVHSEAEFWTRFGALIQEAKKQNASVVVFPEYFSLSLLMLTQQGLSFHQALLNSRFHSESVLSNALEIAKRFQIAIALGTLPWVEEEKVLNRAHFIHSSGQVVAQDKIYMTRFESEEWKIHAGEKSLRIFKFESHTCAILTCYDSEFAATSLALATAGVELLFVPSNTDSLHGYWRVRHCCEARAIENQLFVAMSSVVEGDPDLEAINEHVGRAGIFSPCDVGFPADGILSLGQENAEGLTIADLDFSKLQEIRRNGTVLNLRDSKHPDRILISSEF